MFEEMPKSIKAEGSDPHPVEAEGVPDAAESSPAVVHVQVQLPPLLPPNADLSQVSEAVAVAQQAELAFRAEHRSEKALRDVDELGLLLKQHRFRKLDYYAQRYHWNLDAPPAKAAVRPDIERWWTEWRDLKVTLPELEGMLANRSPLPPRPSVQYQLQQSPYEAATPNLEAQMAAP